MKENESSFNKWKEDVKEIKAEISANIEKAYDSKLTKLREELNEVGLKLFKSEYMLNEEKEKNDILKKQLEGINQENELIRKLLGNKDNLIQSLLS